MSGWCLDIINNIDIMLIVNQYFDTFFFIKIDSEIYDVTKNLFIINAVKES